MERELLTLLGGLSRSSSSRPILSPSDLEARTRLVQANAVETSTTKHYVTGARDYISFCINHNLPIEPTPATLARYISYPSLFVASGPKYLSGARFLQELFPEFERNRAHPAVQRAIAGARKLRADGVRRKDPLRTHSPSALSGPFQ
jgi:hypothetical protein